MTLPGNHEMHGNFSHYDYRFSMIGDRYNPKPDAPLTSRLSNHYHSFDIGPAHILMFSTEFYYYTGFGWDQIPRQFEFLEEDLKRAKANRAERPWIIAMAHRSPYCIKMGDGSCDTDTMDRPEIRLGIHMHNNTQEERKYGLEKLFYDYGVDIALYGHDHFFARTLPIYNYTVDTSAPDPYINPNGTVHIVTGTAVSDLSSLIIIIIILIIIFVSSFPFFFNYP